MPHIFVCDMFLFIQCQLFYVLPCDISTMSFFKVCCYSFQIFEKYPDIFLILFCLENTLCKLSVLLNFFWTFMGQNMNWFDECSVYTFNECFFTFNGTECSINASSINATKLRTIFNSYVCLYLFYQFLRYWHWNIQSSWFHIDQLFSCQQDSQISNCFYSQNNFLWKTSNHHKLAYKQSTFEPGSPRSIKVKVFWSRLIL